MGTSAALRAFLHTGRVAPGVPGVTLRELIASWGPPCDRSKAYSLPYVYYAPDNRRHYGCEIPIHEGETHWLGLNFYGARNSKVPAPLKEILSELRSWTTTRQLRRFGFQFVHYRRGNRYTTPDLRWERQIGDLRIVFQFVPRKQRGRRVLRVQAVRVVRALQ